MTRRQRRERTARRRRHVAASAGLAVGATFAAPAVAHATDFPVTNLHDTGAGSLRQAITDANSNSGADRILFQSGLSGTIQIGSTIMPPITESVEILGPGANQLTIHGNASNPVLGVNLTATHDPVTISGLKLSGGGDGGQDGAGFYNFDSRLTIADCVISGNRGNDGGGIYTQFDTTIRNSRVSGNSAGYGAGVDSSAPLTIIGSTIEDNSASNDGGGLFASGPLTVTGSTFGGNSAHGRAGGIYAKDVASIADTTVADNTANEAGGGLVPFGDTTLTDSTISGNSAGGLNSFNGGGIYTPENAGALTVTRSTFSGNSAGAGGGGIYASHGTGGPVNISNSTFMGNGADSGGGVNLQRDGTITGSTIAGNSATSYGGGLYLYFGDLGPGVTGPQTVVNSTISGNSSGKRAGGVYAFGDTTDATTRHIAFDSVTIAGNSAAVDGGGISNVAYIVGTGTSAAPSLANTIVATNTAPAGQDLQITPGSSNHSGPFDTSFSLIQNAAPSAFTGGASDVLGVDPQLGPLASNGGPTQTQALSSTSPAIDKGATSLTSDQRGFARPVDQPLIPNAAGGDAADIGAFELSQLPLPAIAPAPATPHLAFGTLKFGPGGATVTLTCADAECDGTAQLTTTEKLRGNKILSLARKKKRTRRKTVVVGAKGFAIQAGKSATLTVPLNRTGKALLKKFGKVPVKLTVTMNQGGRAVTVKTAKSVVKAKAKKRRRHR